MKQEDVIKLDLSIENLRILGEDIERMETMMQDGRFKVLNGPEQLTFLKQYEICLKNYLDLVKHTKIVAGIFGFLDSASNEYLTLQSEVSMNSSGYESHKKILEKLGDKESTIPDLIAHYEILVTIYVNSYVGNKYEFPKDAEVLECQSARRLIAKYIKNLFYAYRAKEGLT